MRLRAIPHASPPWGSNRERCAIPTAIPAWTLQAIAGISNYWRAVREHTSGFVIRLMSGAGSEALSAYEMPGGQFKATLKASAVRWAF